MYFIFRATATFCLIFVLFITLIGLFSNPKTTVILATVIESPPTIVWQYVTNIEKIRLWRPEINNLEILNMKEMNNEAILQYDQNRRRHQEKVVEWIPEKKVSFQRIDSLNYPLLNKILTSIEIKALADGSAEINVVLKYNVKTFFSRIYNTLYLRNYFTDQYENQLAVLKNVLEKI